MTKEQLKQALALSQYPRSAHYDPHWVLSNLMGPNVLWLPEGWRDWLEVCADAGYQSSASQAEMLRIDAGRTLGFSRIVARKP